MQLTPEQVQVGKDNFNTAVSVTRRSFLMGAAAAMPGLGAAYFGYQKLQGNPVRTGFIGTGDEGSVLINEHPPDYMDIVAVADIRPTNLERAFRGDNNDVRQGLVRRLGPQKAKDIKRYADHRELLADPDIEAVVISVPLNVHASIALDALEAGKHVLTEKLMAHSVGECKEMIAKAREKRRLLAVGHQRHYSVLYDNAHHVIREGLLGDIKFIRAQWHRNNSFPGRDSWNKGIPREDAAALKDRLGDYGFDSMEKLVNWRLYPDTGGGLMAELGSHQLDACSIFLGKVQPIAVQGFGGRNYFGVKGTDGNGDLVGVGPRDKWDDRREIDDHVYVTFEFPGPLYHVTPDDVVIVTYSSINTNSLEPYGESVFGSRGSLIVRQEQEALLFKEAGGGSPGGGPDQRLWIIDGRGDGPVLSASESLAPTQEVSTNVTGKVSRGYTEEMEHFCHCIRTDNFEPPEKGGLRCPGERGMADAVMALTSNLAMKYKKRIVFKPEWFDPDRPETPETDSEIVG